MKPIPMLFKGAMVRAILDGTKTQTRRVLKVDADDLPYVGSWHEREDGRPFVVFQDAPGDQVISRLQYNVPYAPGDLLWVREEWSAPREYRGVTPREMPPGIPIWYWADGNPGYGDWTKPKVSLHIPMWFSRLTLEVTDVRVQRLHEISEDDALAEGIIWSDKWRGFIVPKVEHPNKDFPVLSRPTAREMYAALWDTINGSGEWLANRWIVAVTFKVHRLNVLNVMESLKNVGDRISPDLAGSHPAL